MEELRRYILSVAAAAALCGILSGLVKNSASSGVFRVLCGAVMAAVVLIPAAKVECPEFLLDLDSFSLEGAAAAFDGEKISQAAIADIIKERTEAYILDKASAMDIPLSVEVMLNGETVPVPVKAALSGNIGPYDRQRISDMLEAELGITKENQIWTG